MSKYDNEREKLGINPMNKSNTSTKKTISKYDDERKQLKQLPTKVIEMERPKPTTLNLPSANPLRPTAPTGIMYNKPVAEEPRRTLIPKLISLVDKDAGSFAQAFENSLFNPLGLKTLIDKGVSKLTGNDNPYQEDRKLQEEHPIAGMVGKLGSDIAFGTPVFKSIGAGVSKALPFLGQATSIAAKGTMGALEGAGYGLLEGGIRGVEQGKGFRGTAEDALSTAKDYAMFGGLLGGAVGGIGKGYKAIKNVGDDVDNIFGGYRPNIEGNGFTPPLLRPRQVPQAIESILKPINERGSINSPLENVMPIEGQPQKGINQFRETTNMIEPTPLSQSKFDYIKTIDDLPNDVPSLEAYVNEMNQYKMLDGFRLDIFSEAEKRLSKFRSNTIERNVDFDEATLNELGHDDFGYSPEKVAEWQRKAQNAITKNKESVMKDIEESKAIAGGQQAHEAAIITKELFNEYKSTGNIAKFKKWLITVAEKTRETARALKGTDTAYQKRSAEGQLIRATRETAKETESIFDSNPTIKKAYTENTKETKKLIENIKAEQQNTIDNMKETIDALRTQNIKLINDAKVPKGAKELPPKPPKIAGETNFPQMLQNKISNALQPKNPQEVGTIRNMINDLFGEAKDKIPFPKKLKRPDEKINTLANSYKLRQYAGEIRTKAIELLKQEFKDNADVLKMLDDYEISGLRPPHSKKLLNDILNQRLGGINPPSPSTATPSTKPQLSKWVKDWYATGRGERENFVQKLIEETGLTGDAANSLKNLLDSKMHVATKQMKDRLLELAMKPPSPKGVVKNATTKLKELTNIGLFENNKFVNRITEKTTPLIKQLMRENNINLNEVVKLANTDKQQALAILKRDIFKNASIDDKEIIKLLDMVNREFKSLSLQKQKQILDNLVKEKTPPIKKTMAEKLREKINLGVYGDELDATLTSAVKEKYDLPDLTSDDIKFITETMDSVKGLDERSEAFLEGMAKVDSLISNKTTSSLAEKVGNWNMISMLGNASSQVTNVGGNLLRFGAYVGLNPLRRSVDKMLGGQRIAGKIDFEKMGKGFKQGFRGTERDMLGGKSLKDIKSIRELYESLANPINTNPNNIKNGKFETGYKIPFKNKPLRVASNLVSSALTAGDRPFEQVYRNNLIKTLKKNQGVSEITPEIQQAADDIAADLTFKGENILSKGALGIRGAGDKLIKSLGIEPANTKGIKNVLYNSPQIVSQSLLPFAKTPANLAMTALDFSPLGLIRGGGKFLANKNNMTLAKKAQIVESLTSGIAGTGLMGLGYGLKQAGNITEGKLENKTASNQQAQLGKQSDALKIGNKNIDLKKFYPLTAPIVAGANLSPQSYFDSIGSVINNYTDNNLLQNVSKAAELFSNKASVDKGKVLADLGLNMASQSIPSLIKKSKYIKDDFERNTKSDSISQYSLNKIKTQLPILSETLPPKVDYMGEPIKQYGGKNTFGNVMFNPYKITEQKQDKNLEESLRLFEKFGDTSVLMPDASTIKEVGGVKLSVEQQNQYQKLLGQNSILELNNIFNKKALIDGTSYTYNDLPDELKQEVFSKAISNGRTTAQNEMKSFLGIDTKQEKLDKRIETIKNKILYNQFGLSK